MLTDATNISSLFAYDALGRLTRTAQAPDTLSSPTASYQYSVTCPTTGASEPCVTLITTQRLQTGSGGATVASATYYDGWGRAVETVSPANLNGATCTYRVSYTLYDAAGRKSFVSDPYFVSATSSTCALSYQRPDTAQPGSSYTYDGLGRTRKVTDPLGGVTETVYTTGSPTSGANITDTARYEAQTTTDANGHQSRVLVDGLGHTRYSERFTGTSTYALEGTTRSDYDWLGHVTAVYGPNPPTAGAPGLSTTAQTTVTYDLLGRKTALTDADLGSGWQFGYDRNGNLVMSRDPRGSTGGGVFYAGYDGTNRQLWRSVNSNGTSPYVSYSYDTAGRVTAETFTGGTSGNPLRGSYGYTYDGRGQLQTFRLTTESAASYTLTYAYNDAGQPAGLTYSDGEQLALGYNAYGWLNDVRTTPRGASTATVLMTAIQYGGVGGAAQRPTSATLANGTYAWSANYDNALRPTSVSLTNSGGSTTYYRSSRTYDAVGNVTGVDTQLAGGGTDSQRFCYDDLDRLVWAGATGTPPCGGGAISAGSLTSAQYTASYSYDALNRLTSASGTGAAGSGVGSYTYGASGRPHAATATTSGYSAAYDAAGDMTCRAPTSATTCAGTPTGAQYSYDAERRLSGSQNTPSAPTTQAAYLYDGEGHRVEQAVQQGGGITTSTYYLPGGVEEVRSEGSLAKDYIVGDMALGLNTAADASGISYLMSDGLGSVQEVLDGSGTVTASQLHSPYGQVRYRSGVMPTSKGFTGQRDDAAVNGLLYYDARSYDPLLGQFTTGDRVADGLNRYGYVAGNPTTRTDPTGQRWCADCSGGGSGGDNGGGPSCHSDASCDPTYGKGQPSTLTWQITRYNRTYARCANSSCTVRYGQNQSTRYRGMIGGMAGDETMGALQATGPEGQAALLEMLQQQGQQYLADADQRIADVQAKIDALQNRLGKAISNNPIDPSAGWGKLLQMGGALLLFALEQDLANLKEARETLAAQITLAIQDVRDATLSDTGVITVYETQAPPANGMPSPLPSQFTVVWQYSTSS